MKRKLSIILLTWLGLLAVAVASSTLSGSEHFPGFPGGPPTGNGIPLARLLNGDGSVALDRGIDGAIDADGWEMAIDEKGSPVFRPATLNGVAADSNLNWSEIFSLRGVNGTVNAFALVGTDLYVGGAFTVAGGVSASRVAKWDGSSWSALGAGVNNTVNALTVVGTDLYAGGTFTTAGGVTVNRIAKWDGTSWSALAAGVNNSVFALATDGVNLYAAGSFTVAGADSISRVAKWDGASWSGLGVGVNNTVYALAMMGTDLYAGGAFTSAGGASRSRVAKWDGTVWSALGTGVNSTVRTLIVNGTTLYAAGQFGTAGGVTVNRVAKWSGSAWSGFGTGVNNTVYALAMVGTDLYAGGVFTTAGGSAISYAARWNGAGWSALGGGLNNRVNAFAVSGANLIAGGLFLTADGETMSRVASWNGSSWNPLGTGSGSGVDNVVNALAVIGTDLYVGGTFLVAGNISVNRIAKWDGAAWSALGTGLNNSVTCMAVLGSDLYVGGTFTTAGGLPAGRIAKWDGVNWTPLGAGLNNTVNAITVVGGDVYAGGTFTTADSLPANRVAKWNGIAWTALGSGTNNTVFALIPSGTDLIAGGQFTTAGGTTVNRVARWNGSAWSAFGTGTNGIVRALLLDGPTLYVGGDFTTAGGVTVNRVAKWNGTAWSALAGGTGGVVRGLAMVGGNLYVGGDFTSAGGSAANRIALYDGTSWLNLGSGANGVVRALSTIGQDLYVGGDFLTAGGKASSRIALWTYSTYTITVTQQSNGTIAPGTVDVGYAANQSFTITPDPGYHIDSVLVDDVNVGKNPSFLFSNVDDNHDITAYFSINVYTLTASASSGGTISPSGQVAVDHGASRSFTITPDAGYHIDSVVVDGVNQGTPSSYDFTNVTADQWISAHFSINVYTLAASATSGGNITPSGAVGVNHGASRSFTITPDTGYHIDSVVVDGVNQGTPSSYDFTNVTADHTISAYFSINVYTLAASATSGGNITPSGAVGVNHGASRSFTITPDAGYHIDSVVVDGVNQGTPSSYDFTNVTADHTISAYFSINVYTLAASATSGGNITPSGAVGVNHGASRSFTITPDAGYHIDSVVVDGVNQGAVPSYDFTNVTTDHVIAAAFSINAYIIAASASTGGTVSPSGQVAVDHGASRSFTITPDAGYHIDSVVVDGVNQGTPSSYDFTNVTADQWISAHFSINVYTLAASASSGGTISPSGEVAVDHGASRSFTITPDAGYHIDSVVVDGVNRGAVGTYDFTNVTAGHSIAAFFSVDPNPVPVLASLSVDTVCTGGPDLQVTLTGSSFVTGSVVRVNGAEVPAVFVTPDVLIATIPAPLLSGPGILAVAAYNPAPGGGSSAEKYITVGAPPSIITQPAGLDACAGSDVAIVVEAGGSGLTYQWFFNGAPLTDGPGISGSATGSLSMSSVGPASEGLYSVTIRSSCGVSTVSSAVRLTIRNGPSIIGQPSGAIRFVGQSVTFTVAAAGTGLSYAWRKDGVLIPGAAAASFSIAVLAPGDAGTYDVMVIDSCGASMASSPANLSVVRRPVTSRLTIWPPAPVYTQSIVIKDSLFNQRPSGGKVQFMVNGVPLGDSAAVGSDGTASIVIPFLDAGVYAITAGYGGTWIYDTSTSGAVDLEISKYAVTSALTSSKSLSREGEAVSFRVVLGPVAPGTGVVQFFDGSTPIGGPVFLGADGSAELSISTLSTGQHFISSMFGGSLNFSPSLSNTLPHDVYPDDSSSFRSATMADWALSADQRGRHRSVRRRPDKVNFQFLLTAPENCAGFRISFNMTAGGSVIPLGPGQYSTFTAAKEVEYSGTIEKGQRFRVDGVGSRGRPIRTRVRWGTGSGAKSVPLLPPDYLRNQPGLPLPNLNNVVEEVFAAGAFPAGLLVGVPQGERGAKSVIHPTFAIVRKSLAKKTRAGIVMHANPARCLGSFDNAMHIVKQQKGLPPTKHNNRLFGEALALKLNIAASRAGAFPVGFGELTFNNPGDPGNPFNGRMVNGIVDAADSVLSCLLIDRVSFEEMADVLSVINGSFASGRLDTVSFSLRTVFRPSQDLTGIPFMHKTPGVSPVSLDVRAFVERVPAGFELYQNYPNPFNPSTTIRWSLERPARLTLVVYDVLGREVARPVDGEIASEGEDEVDIDAGGLASGIYYYRLEAVSYDEETESTGGTIFSGVRKMMLVK